MPNSQIIPIHRTNISSLGVNNKNDIWFNAFDFEPGHDANIRWLSRPSREIIRKKYSHDAEKFRVTFDVENFQPEQIKVCIQNRKLTITGVYEERTENSLVQKQFERNFDLPANADIECMASFITPNKMLVVEIPIDSSTQTDHLNISSNTSDGARRLSFSLNKFNSSNDQSLLSTSNDLSIPSQPARRTSLTKTTTITTTNSTDLSPEFAQLLKTAEITTGNISRPPNAAVNQSDTSSTKQTTVKSSELNSLPVEIPPELLLNGGTITIQKRKVSITRGTDEKNTIDQTTIARNPDSQAALPNVLHTKERRSSKTISNTNTSRKFTFEEFLQNKTWNPSIVENSDGSKVLHMRLQMKPNIKSDQIKISLNGYDLRVEVDSKVSTDNRQSLNEHSYRQISLLPTCNLDQLKTELKSDGFLHIQVPIKL